MVSSDGAAGSCPTGQALGPTTKGAGRRGAGPFAEGPRACGAGAGDLRGGSLRHFLFKKLGSTESVLPGELDRCRSDTKSVDPPAPVSGRTVLPSNQQQPPTPGHPGAPRGHGSRHALPSGGLCTRLWGRRLQPILCPWPRPEVRLVTSSCCSWARTSNGLTSP